MVMVVEDAVVVADDFNEEDFGVISEEVMVVV